MLENDTICAPATQSGGAIGIVRVSGPEAIEIVNSTLSKDIIQAKGGTLHHCEILDNDGIAIDEVVTSVWRAPYSYTGENSVEVSCHGSGYIMQQIVNRLIAVGCRGARPGEFTERAFLSGKMDLSQAEAVADLIASSNKASHKMAISALKGHFSNELFSLREKLLNITTLLELELDFSDHEDIEFADRNTMLKLANEIDRKVVKLTDSFKMGRAIKEGIPVAIVGRTNVGKSTLLNRLLHEERAIVSEVEGTTRDSIEDVVNIKGINFRFIDTAGFRNTTDKIEKIGIERTHRKISEASIIIWLVDDEPTVEEISNMKSLVGERTLLTVLNKIDLIDESRFSHMLKISAKHGLGIDNLEKTLYEAAGVDSITENTIIVTNARHYDALIRSHYALERVRSAIESHLSADLVAEELKDVLYTLGEITGSQITSDETLKNIFSSFCIGK